MAQFKYYEVILYKLNFIPSAASLHEPSFAFGLLLINMFLFIISLSFDQFWSFGTPALFHIFAALALFYSNLAGKPSYSEEFYHQRLPLPTAASCASQNRATSFPIVAPVKRLQVVHQQSK
uniref:Uncharacterized protein n=1 Tax=Meloidogyne javanica TaxID=6303 RepID=A0A915M631_MELJA